MKNKEIKQTGRRKSSVAVVTIKPGTGKITVNNRDVSEYMPFDSLVTDLKQPLALTKNLNAFDVVAKVKGGGVSGQAGAIRLGITKCLLEYDKGNESDDSYRKTLKSAGMITRDSRVKERYKYGLRKARKGPQFSKR